MAKTAEVGPRQPKPPFPPQPLEPPGIEGDMDPRPRYRAPMYRAAGKLDGDVALVTGGDSGIGRSVAVLFAREGADVAIIYLPQEQSDAEETAGAIETEGRRALLIPGDVSDPEFCRTAVEHCVEVLQRLAILVNNAATQQHSFCPFGLQVYVVVGAWYPGELAQVFGLQVHVADGVFHRQ